MKTKKNASVVTFLLPMLVAFVFLACKSAYQKDSLKNTETAEVSQDLTLNCELYTEAGEIKKEYTLFEAWEQLERYCTTWGRYMVSQSNSVPGNAEGMNAYRKVFVSTCKGDTILDILNSPSGLKIPKQMDPNFVFNDKTFPYMAYGISFEVPVKTPVRVALGNMAIKAYYDVLLEIVEFGKNAEWRNNFLELKQFSVALQDGTEWVSTGEELLEKMFASAPTLVEKIADIKMQNAEDLIAEGVAQRDEWGSLDYGRAPALKEIWGGYAGCSESEMQDSALGMCMDKCNSGCSPIYLYSGPAGCFCENDYDSEFYHVEATKRCAERGGRLPSKSELEALLTWCANNTDTNYCALLKGAQPFWTATKTVVSADTGQSKVYVFHPSLEAQTRFAERPTNEKYQVRCVRYPSLELKDPLQPSILERIPRLTKGIESGVDLIVNNGIDVPSIVEQENWDQLYELVLETVNEERVELGLERYKNLDELLSVNGSDKKALKDAAIYSYAHLVLFPRQLSAPYQNQFDAASFYKFDAGNKFVGWGSPQMSLPTAYYVEKLNRGVKKDNTGIIDISEESNMNTVGLVEVLRDLHQNLVALNWADSETVSEETEKRCKKSLDEAINQVDSFNGKTRIEYQLDYQYDADSHRLSLKLINPSFAEGSDAAPVNQVAIYPLGDPKSLNESPVYEYQNYVDFHQRQRGGLEYYKITSFQRENACELSSSDKRCLPVTVLGCELVKNEDGNVESTCTEIQQDVNSGAVELMRKYNRWMIETRTGEGAWRPIGMISTQDFTGESRAGAFPLDGRALNAAEKIVSRRSDDLSDPDCVPINGLDGECFDRDWVPAIDNELIDTSGNGYEESYRHYLALARTAAEKAKRMRETVMSDIIELKGANGSEEALVDKAIENYIAEIEQICGGANRSATDNLESLKYEELQNSEIWQEILSSDYGCSSETGIPKKGPIHCAEKRNCDLEQPYVLRDYGVTEESWYGPLEETNEIKDNDASADLGGWEIGVSLAEGRASSGIAKMEICDSYLKNMDVDDLENPSRMIEGLDPESSDFEEQVEQRIEMLRCWAQRYRGYMAWYWGGYPVLNFVDVPKAESDSDGKCWGVYCNTKADIKHEIENLANKMDAYFASLKRLESTLEELLLRLRESKRAGDAQKLMHVASTMISEAVTKMSAGQGARDCWKNQLALMRDEFSMSNIRDALEELKYQMFVKPAYKHAEWRAALESFKDDCKDAASTSGVPLLMEYGWLICDMFPDTYVDSWTDTSGGQTCDVWPCFTNTYEGWRTKESEEYGSYSDKSVWEIHNLGSDFVVVACDKNSSGSERKIGCVEKDIVKKVCLNSKWTSFTSKAIEEILPWVVLRVGNESGKRCKRISNCIDGNGEWVYESCPETAGIAMGNGVLKNLYPEMLDEIQNDSVAASEANLKSQLILLQQDIRNAKSEINASLRKIVNLNSALVSLEEKQVNLWDKLFADIAVAHASSAVNTREWKERYDYRREQYRELLKRSRVAAWVARRSIEFRFGINLEDETDKSIYGDVPAEWANDIFKTNTTICGEKAKKEDAKDDDGNSISNCLTPEDRIEEYVQKLEDYVASYGNTPGQNWWFHEDDDTAVISLRDHVVRPSASCDRKTSNLLWFTEELDMDEERIEEVYGDVIGGKLFMSGWNRNNTMAVGADDASFGIPSAVYSAHRTNETGLFGDQEKDETVDRLSVENWEIMIEGGYPSGLSQVIKMEEAMAQEAVSDLEFSAYLRSAPLHSRNNCDVNAGKQYFPAIGKCGIPCEITEDRPAPWGTCPGGETLGTRQVCMKAGERATESGEYEAVFMCDWCSADKGCIHQDGQVIAMQVKNGTEYGDSVYAQRNLVAYPYWKNERQAVNTVDDRQSVIIWSNDRSYLDYDSYKGVTVSFFSTVTENLIPHSENFGQDWVATNLSEKGRAIGPDGTYGATEFMTSAGAQNLSLSLDVQTQKEKGYGWKTNGEFISGYTGSIWAHIDDIQKHEALLTIELRDVNGREHVSKKVVTLDNEWQRIEIFGTSGGNDIEHVSFVISSPDVNAWPEGKSLEVWGAQVEEGRGATVYLPTGKNLLEYTGFDRYRWSPVIVELEYDLEVQNPMGRKGAKRLVDKDLSAMGYVTRTIDIDAALIGKQVTFSLFMKSADGVQRKSSFGLRQYDANGNDISSEFVDDIELGPEWARFKITKTIEQNATKILMSVRGTSDPTTGAIHVWGEQLEVGGHATGWQRTFPTYGNQARWGQDLFYPFDLGVVGAQLEQYGSYQCDEYGNQTSDGWDCIDRKTQDVEECCGSESECITAASRELSDPASECTSTEYSCNPACRCLEGYTDDSRRCGVKTSRPYVRNTYLRSHFDSACAVEKHTELAYPLPGQLVARISDEVKKERFKSMFTEVKQTDGPNYYKYTFPISREAVQSGDFGQFGVISPDNFNYRIRTVAMNVVGTDVVDCSEAESPRTCANQPWVAYDLKQLGEVYIRNHHKQVSLHPFSIPTGRIKGGKAWASEQEVGFPVSGAHQSALQQIQKVSLMGRPLQGTFELRIYETPELVWENLEDIQMILGYHYWTRSE